MLTSYLFFKIMIVGAPELGSGRLVRAGTPIFQSSSRN